jgi:hypothetical protein
MKFTTKALFEATSAVMTYWELTNTKDFVSASALAFGNKTRASRTRTGRQTLNIMEQYILLNTGA